MNIVKKGLSFIMVIVLILTFALPIVNAQSNQIKVMLNGKYLTFDVEPQMINDRIMVPFRAIFEAMDAKVEWNSELFQVTGEKDGKKVELTIGSDEILVTENGKTEVMKIDQAPVIINERTLVPVRFVANAFDKVVFWDNDENTVIIFDIDYFKNEMIKRASNFYECISNFKITNNIKSVDTLDLKIDMEGEESTYNIDCNAKLNTIINENDAYLSLDSDIKINNEWYDDNYNLNAKVYLDDDGIVLKTNILDMFLGSEIEFNDNIYSLSEDGIFVSWQDLGIPNINSFENILDIYINEDGVLNGQEAISFAFESLDGNMNVTQAKYLIDIYDVALDFIQNDKFVKKTNGNVTKYIWSLNKEDIKSAMVKLYTKGIFKDLNLDVSSLLELEKAIDTLEINTIFEFKNNEYISSVLDADIKINNYITENDILNQTNKTYWELSDIQNSVAMYASDYIFLNDNTTIKDAINELIGKNISDDVYEFSNTANEKLYLEDYDLSKYTITTNGIVQKNLNKDWSLKGTDISVIVNYTEKISYGDFKINKVNNKNALNILDYILYMQEENNQEIEVNYDVVVQNAVTVYCMEYITNGYYQQIDLTVEDAINEIIEHNNCYNYGYDFGENAFYDLNISDDILSNYIVDLNGNVYKK